MIGGVASWITMDEAGAGIRTDMATVLERLGHEDVKLKELNLKGSLEAIIERLKDSFCP
ncbi:hypothetical protein HP532_26665 [Pseudomonas sp. CrR25]|nr:hypothetical protein [Pseudomonas sp. CrR25]